MSLHAPQPQGVQQQSAGEVQAGATQVEGDHQAPVLLGRTHVDSNSSIKEQDSQQGVALPSTVEAAEGNGNDEPEEVRRTASALALRLQEVQTELQAAMRQRDTHQVQALMNERNEITAQQQDLRLHPPELPPGQAPEADLELGLDEQPVAGASTLLGGMAHRMSARVTGLGGLDRRVSQQDLRDQGFTTPQANARLVVLHRNEILMNHFSHYAMCFAVCSVLLTIGLCGLFVWHFVEFVHFRNIVCHGSLKPLTLVVLVLSAVDLILGARLYCIDEEGQVQLPRRFELKNLCIFVVLAVMLVNVVGLYWLSKKAPVMSGLFSPAFGSEIIVTIPHCREAAPGLFMATLAHAIGLIVYSVFLALNFLGLGRMLRMMMDRGLLRTSGAAPEGALEHNTVRVDTIDECEAECPICLEEMTPENALRTKDCHHVFHAQCLKHWMQMHRACPLCRHNLGNVV